MASSNTDRITPILVERRFPVDLSHSIQSIEDLYDASKRARWDPNSSVPWNQFKPDAYPEDVRRAAALSWSRRAWSEYTSLPETPSLLIRFCLELDREVDPKYYLSVRNTEEAWHVEACHRMATELGGYVNQPANPTYATVFNGTLAREALDADNLLDGYVAAHCAVEDSLDLELWRGYLANARDAVAQAALQHCVEDKKRHAAFGWLYLEERHKHWDGTDRLAIQAAVETYVTGMELRGYHFAWLAEQDNAGNIVAADIVAADQITAQAGLGALTPEQEADILRSAIGGARERLAALGVTVPDFDDPRTGRF